MSNGYDDGIPDAGALDLSMGESALLPRAFEIDPGLLEHTKLTTGQQISRSLNDVTGFIGKVFHNPAFLQSYQQQADGYKLEDQNKKRQRLSIAMGQAAEEQRAVKAQLAAAAAEQKRQEDTKAFIAKNFDSPQVIVNPDGTRRPATGPEVAMNLMALQNGDYAALANVEFRDDMRKAEEAKATTMAREAGQAEFDESPAGRAAAKRKQQDAAAQASAVGFAGETGRVAGGLKAGSKVKLPDGRVVDAKIADDEVAPSTGPGGKSTKGVKSPAAREFLKEVFSVQGKAETAAMKPDALTGELPVPERVTEQGRKYAESEAKTAAARLVNTPTLWTDGEFASSVATYLSPANRETMKKSWGDAILKKYGDNIPQAEFDAFKKAFGG